MTICTRINQRWLGGGGEGGNDVMGASLQRHEKLMQRRSMAGALALLENVIDERYCLVLCDEISDHFPLIDETLRQLEFCNSVISHIYSEIRQKLSNSACKDATPLPSGPFSLYTGMLISLSRAGTQDRLPLKYKVPYKVYI